MITEDTVEEKIVERAELKLCLDQVVIQQGLLENKTTLDKLTILDIIRYGSDKHFAANDSEVTDDDIDHILNQGEIKVNTLLNALTGQDIWIAIRLTRLPVLIIFLIKLIN